MLTVSGLSSGYQGAKVLHQVSFDVAAGEIVCLLGRNGAGTVSYTHLTLPTIYSV